MKKPILILTILLMITKGYSGFCCNDGNSGMPGQDKCYDVGECCNGFWYSSCSDFTITVSGPSIFRVGQKTPVTVYIENIGAYPDTYTLTYEVMGIDSDLIKIDMNDADMVSDLGPGEIRKVYPRITVLASTLTGTIKFNATSTEPNTRNANLAILESDAYLSLPEFSSLYFIEFFFMIGIIYFLKSQRYF